MTAHDLCHDGGVLRAVVDQVQATLQAAPATSAYRAALHAALQIPGNILSEEPNERWSRLVWTCCEAAGGDRSAAVPVAAAVELFMVALDMLDDVEDGEESPLDSLLGSARALNASTGLILLAHQSLLNVVHGSELLELLLNAGLRACSGQDADLTPAVEQPPGLRQALEVAGAKSATLVAAICQLGACCAGADAAVKAGYAQFGWCLGMVAQLINDIVALAPNAVGKTDLALGRPTLPLAYAAHYLSALSEAADAAAARAALWSNGPTYLTWTVAETYRQQAIDLIPQLTADPSTYQALAALLPKIHWTDADAVEG
jgi:geranylgeranyl pyrophosphate synthase